MTVKDLVRPLPGIRRLSLLRQRIAYTGSASFWEQIYRSGETSGPGSYGALGDAKAEFLNSFIRENGVQSVTEFGCGDGHQLSLADYPRYVGLDVSPTAIGLCKRRFAADPTKSFFLYDGACFVDQARLFSADMAISLDVLYHLIEDSVFETHISHLFAAGERYVIIYSTNAIIRDDAPHVRHRCFSEWVNNNYPQWCLTHVTRGSAESQGRADFYVYERRTVENC